MGKPMSVDLRERAVAAVGGRMSRRKAAERFGVSISSAIRWTGAALGAVRAWPQGGDKRSARIETHALGRQRLLPSATIAGDTVAIVVT